jgi:hypothetical protein
MMEIFLLLNTTIKHKLSGNLHEAVVSNCFHMIYKVQFSFTFWKEAVSDVFQWREQDYKA